MTYAITDNITVQDTPGFRLDGDWATNLTALDHFVKGVSEDSTTSDIKSDEQGTPDAILFCISWEQLLNPRYEPLIKWIKQKPSETIQRFYIITHYDSIYPWKFDDIKHSCEQTLNSENDIFFITNIRNQEDMVEKNLIRFRYLWTKIVEYSDSSLRSITKGDLSTLDEKKKKDNEEKRFANEYIHKISQQHSNTNVDRKTKRRNNSPDA